MKPGRLAAQPANRVSESQRVTGPKILHGWFKAKKPRQTGAQEGHLREASCDFALGFRRVSHHNYRERTAV